MPPPNDQILVSRQQTRFFIHDNNASKEIDVKDLSIAIKTSEKDAASAAAAAASSAKVKGKAKAKKEGLELLSGAELHLSEGWHYGLIGRNGTGKSTILKALAEHLIPGIPLTTQIVLLQQTEEITVGETAKTVLQHVIESDPYRNKIVKELGELSAAFESTDGMDVIKALRKLRLDQANHDLFEANKTANLRSGARGYDARKDLIESEKNQAERERILAQPIDEIEPSAVEVEQKEAADLQAELQDKLELMQYADVSAKARRILKGLGFTEEMFEWPVKNLSGGWVMRCLLASALTQYADVLILDEPTNFLDLLGIIWLQNYLNELSDTQPDTTIIVVSHDRDFLNGVCPETIILKDLKLTYYNGSISSYEKSLRHERLKLMRMKEAQDKQVSHIEKTIQNNLKVGKKTGDDNKLRQAVSRQKRLDDRVGMMVSAKGGRFKLNRDRAGYFLDGMDRVEVPKEELNPPLAFPAAPDLRFPGSLLSLENVTFTHPKSRKPVFADANLVVHTGDRVGLLGLNGAGKSTLIRLLVGQTAPSRGARAQHPRLKLGYYSQHAIDELRAEAARSPDITALALLLRDFPHLDEQAARALMAGLGLPSRGAAQTLLPQLSGGQLVRVALARILADPPHVLVLDEPTAHLDLPGVAALGKALKLYGGAVVLVTHDRYFMRLVIEGDSGIEQDGSETESEDEDEKDTVERRRVVMELKAGVLKKREGGVDSWEAVLEKRLKRLGL